MRRFLVAVLAAGFVAAPIFAGALTLQAEDPKANPEAVAKNAVVAVHTTACNSPEKTVITASAEGIVNGKRVTMPLTVIRLSQPGAFAVKQEWPSGGTWAVTMIATNPDYKNYATSVVVPADAGAKSWAKAKVFYHAPSAQEIDSVLKQAALE
jgi:hypothetical protein